MCGWDQAEIPTKYINDPIERCETIVKEMPYKPIIEHGGDEPHYNWREDRIRMPQRENFVLSDEYYATLFHELAHNAANLLCRTGLAVYCF